VTGINDRGLKHQFLYLLASSETHSPKASAVKEFANSRLRAQANRTVAKQGLTMLTMHSAPRIASAGAMGLRILPVVGYALLAYDLWRLYDAWSED